MTLTLDVHTAALGAALNTLRDRIGYAVSRRRFVDPQPDDLFRGLYVSDDQVDRLLAGDHVPIRADGPLVDDIDPGDRLGRLAEVFGLDEVDLSVLIVAAAPDLDPAIERLYGYLHDDVTRRRASVGLSLELCGQAPEHPVARLRLSPDGPLVERGLIVVEEHDRPLLTRPLIVPERVIAFLLGDDEPDPMLAPATLHTVAVELAAADLLARAIQRGIGLTYVCQQDGGAGTAMAEAAVSRAGRAVVGLDLDRIEPADLGTVAAVAAREAGLQDGVIVAALVDSVAERGAAGVRLLSELAAPTVLVGDRRWDPRWSRATPLVLDAPPWPVHEREAQWRQTLGPAAHGVDIARVTAPFRLTPEQVDRAARAARQQAAIDDRPIEAADVQRGARSQNAADLERLAHRVAPTSTWNDVVVPANVERKLRELSARTRLRDRVLDDWGLHGPSLRGRGITALFAGESGTGKTLAAQVIAADLGLDLYVVDLSTVVDKYVGETEKNLDRIFDEADRVNAVLLFDEADALFGKRSEVGDAHDRYANVEVAYLLQRMERFDGLALLTTNLRANLDEAFTRRLDAIVDFPMPDDDDRRRLWRLNLPASVPQADAIDVDFLAAGFELSGGSIRNITLGAAYLAADNGQVLGMTELVRATEREYQKLGRLCTKDEFGAYWELVGSRRNGDAQPAEGP